ncbi:hypothetical protein KZY67_03540 [Prevotella melaninogenica]|uniref:hypothetical protein n=1 Tax=Prevotella melaninogenica TaxID=28132 RepID=UPI001C5FF39D|nr:hypothetical protein [Prevotella melaninogenica]MBW4740946.1 hypothetical protein [Prevotella melaninogenica]MBW4911719.1 hypothetical protein [Prevotella melaninogenica]
MKRNYIAPAIEQITVKVEQFLLDLSFNDSPVDPGTALSKKNTFDTSDDEADDALSVTSNGEIGIGMNSLWDE